MSDPSANLLDVLTTAIAGLQWMSESDYPFEVVHWQNPTAAELTIADLLQFTQHAPDVSVAIEDVNDFFAIATHAQDWHTPAEQAIVKQYQALVTTLQQNLSDLKVYRVGDVDVDLYIVGKTATGAFVGLSTHAVETG